jgi:NADPH2 dehydrogenase
MSAPLVGLAAVGGTALTGTVPDCAGRGEPSTPMGSRHGSPVPALSWRGGGEVVAALFAPFELKGLRLKNRVVMSPMCMYSVWKEDGVLNQFHHTHLVSRAVGGAALILVEMTDVEPDGRITVNDSGIWSDAHIDVLARIAEDVHRAGAAFGIQIAHAGRKAHSQALSPVGPSAIPFSDQYRVPHALTRDEVRRVVDNFGAGAARAVKAGVDVLELHGAHGYLVHQFMSRASNRRDDEYGEPTRFGREVIQAMRAAMPSAMPLMMRVSGTEHDPSGYGIEQLSAMARVFQAAGVDLFDVSSGGNLPVRVREYPGYQVPYAEAVRRATGGPVMAVGVLDDYHLAESVVAEGRADLVAIGRGMLRDPYWANSAALALGEHTLLPPQYHRAVPVDRR